ncbi:hypothetical protein [Haloplanus salilacus]|uniref:hypothetical protein n=1 Tax=Haloplanus salilacus TaxID=2949994 RepID=UPI0030CBDAA5
MSYHTLRTRPRCERLADRSVNDPVAVGLPVTLLLALVHPFWTLAALLALAGGYWLSVGRRPDSS